MRTSAGSRLVLPLALSAAVLVTGVLALPAPALAAPDTAQLAALTEVDPATGRNRAFDVRPGEVGTSVLGVANVGTAPLSGVVVQIRVLDPLDFAKRYDNCLYAVDANMDIAWCEFDNVLPVNETYALAESFVRVDPDATEVGAIVFQWFSAAWATAGGGLAGVAPDDSVRGTQGTLGLAPRSLRIPEPGDRLPINFAYLNLLLPASPEPAPGTETPTRAPTAAASPGPVGTGDQLPVTGSQTGMITGAGAALLLLGAAAFLMGRRRRARFVA